jgi:hypothetical protein
MRRDVFPRLALPLVGQTESAKPSPKTSEGAICVQWVRCGKPNCRCMHDGPRHGPYYARYWWSDGRRYKRYVRRAEAQEIASACADRRATECAERAQADAAYRAWREVRAMIMEIEHGER